MLQVFKNFLSPLWIWFPFLSQRNTRNTLAFAAMNFVLGVSYACGLLASNAMLISQVGTGPLFYVYLGSSLLSILTSLLFFLIIDKLPRTLALIIAHSLLGLAVISLWYFLGKNPEQNFYYYALRIGFYTVFILTSLQFWLQVSNYFTNLEARVRYPFLVAAGILGWIVGSLLLNQLALVLQTRNFIFIWGLCVLSAPFFLLFIISNPIKYYASASNSSSDTVGVKSIEESTPSFKKRSEFSRLVSILFLFWACYTFFGYGVDFFFNDFAVKLLPSEDHIAAFFGKVVLISLIIVLVYQSFIAGRLMLYLTVDQMMYIMVGIMTLSLAVVYWYPTLWTLVLAEGVIVYFVDFMAVSLLQPIFNIIPNDKRGRAKVIIEGLGRPMGSVFLLLAFLGVGRALGLPILMSILFLTALLFLFYPLYFSKIYYRYLVSCLKSSDEKMVVNAIQALGEKNKSKAAQPLIDLLNHSKGVQLKRTIVLSLGKMRSDLAFKEIVGLFETRDENMQMAVLESLSYYKNYQSMLALFQLLKSGHNVSTRVKHNAILLLTKFAGKKMIPFLLESLQVEDDRIKANTIESIGILKDFKTIPIITPYLEHSNNRIVANAAVALFPFRKTRLLAIAAIEGLYQKNEREALLSALYAMGEVKWEAHEQDLLELLKSQDKGIREHACVALAKMNKQIFCPVMIELLLDEDENYALKVGRHLARLPYFSRTYLFEQISEMSKEKVQTIVDRLDKMPTDFHAEKEMLLSYHQLEELVPV